MALKKMRKEKKRLKEKGGDTERVNGSNKRT